MNSKKSPVKKKAVVKRPGSSAPKADPAAEQSKLYDQFGGAVGRGTPARLDVKRPSTVKDNIKLFGGPGQPPVKKSAVGDRFQAQKLPVPKLNVSNPYFTPGQSAEKKFDEAQTSARKEKKEQLANKQADLRKNLNAAILAAMTQKKGSANNSTLSIGNSKPKVKRISKVVKQEKSVNRLYQGTASGHGSQPAASVSKTKKKKQVAKKKPDWVGTMDDRETSSEQQSEPESDQDVLPPVPEVKEPAKAPAPTRQSRVIASTIGYTNRALDYVLGRKAAQAPPPPPNKVKKLIKKFEKKHDCSLCPKPVTNILIPFITSLRNFDIIQKHVIPYLLGYHTMDNGQGAPNQTIFRLALTCKKAKKFVEYVIEPHTLSSGADYRALEKMIAVFMTRPDFQDKVTPQAGYHPLNDIWDHPVFGGPVLNPVNRLDQIAYKLEPRSNKLLQKMIETVTEDYEYVCLRDIRLPLDLSQSLATRGRVMDIQVLIPKGTVHLEHDYYKEKDKENPIAMLFDVPLFLTGFGRCIQYEVYWHPDGCTKERRFVQMKEGQFENGSFKGYGRQLDNRGECKVGFWDFFQPRSYGRKKTETVGTGTIAVPNGKWAWYDEDGNYIADEGFYIGVQDPKEPWNIVLREITLDGRKEKHLEKHEHGGEFKSYNCNCSMGKKTYKITSGKKGGVLGIGARELPKLLLV